MNNAFIRPFIRPVIRPLLRPSALLGCAAAAAIAAGCAAPDTRPAAGPETEAAGEAAGGMTPAAASLLAEAAAERSAGHYDRASLALERAIRIEPGRAAIWLELARVRLDEGDPAQAGQLARKACALGAGQPDVMSDCERIIRETAGAVAPR